MSKNYHILIVSCPSSNVAMAMEFLKQQGCKVYDISEMHSKDGNQMEPAINEVIPDCPPGIVLRGYRYRDDLTQAELSKLAGIPRHHISEMENNKRPIGKANARKLADVFNTDPRMFLEA